MTERNVTNRSAIRGGALACFIALALSGHEVAAQEKRAEGRDALPNAKSLSGEERQRTIRELQKKDYKELEAHVPFLLDVCAMDLFDVKWRYNAEEVGKLIGEEPKLFPERLIAEIEKQDQPLRTMAACQVLLQNHKRLDADSRDRIWSLIPKLAASTTASVRWSGISLAFMFTNSKDVLPIFEAALDDMAFAEGAPHPIALRAIVGVTASKKCSPTGVAKIIRLIDSPNIKVSRIAAHELPLIVKHDEKLRDLVLRVYIERIEKGLAPMVHTVGSLPDLLPDPKAATSLLTKTYQREDADVAIKRVVIAALKRIPGAQSHCEPFLREELQRCKEDQVLYPIVEYLTKCAMLEPKTVKALLDLRDRTTVPGIRSMINRLLHDLDSRLEQR